MLFAKVTEPNAGYSHDKESVALLDPDGHYNSVNFTFYENIGNGEMVKHDLYSDPKYNPYLSRVVMQKFD